MWTPFGNVQWRLYGPAHIAPLKASLIDASTLPAARIRSERGTLGVPGVRLASR